MAKTHAIGIIHEENGAFGISFPDFPGCISSGTTLDEVISNGAQALAFHVDGMAEDGEAMPEIRTPAALKEAEPDWLKGGFAVAIPVDLPGKAVRINITVEERALERIDRAAAAEGKSRSGFLVSAALEKSHQAAQTKGKYRPDLNNPAHFVDWLHEVINQGISEAATEPKKGPRA